MAAVIPVVISFLGARSQPLPGPCLAFLGGGTVAGGILYTALKGYTPSGILYRGQELADLLKYKSDTKHILTTDISITPDVINRIPGFAFRKAENECDKFTPIINDNLFWINKSGVTTEESKKLIERLETYHARMGAISSVINSNDSVYQSQKVKHNDNVSNTQQQEKNKVEIDGKKIENKVTWMEARLKFLTNIVPWWRSAMVTVVSIPTLFIIFKVTARIAQLV